MPSVESFLLQATGLLALALLVLAPVPLLVCLLHRSHPGALAEYPMTYYLLAGLVLWTVLECALVSTLGWAGWLRVGPMLLVAALLLGSGLWFAAPVAARPRWPEILLRQARMITGTGRLYQLILLVIASSACLLAAQLLLFPVTDIDSLSYQLPRVVQWYQSGRFHDPMPQHGDLVNSYPFGSNTLFFLAAAPMGHDQFILLFNIVAWLMLGFAVHGLGRLCGGRRTDSLAAAMLTLLMPVSMRLVRTAHIDLAFAAFFLASAYFLLDAHLRRDLASIILGAACAGMMLGTKMSGVPYALLLFVFWVGLSVHRRPARPHGLRWRRGAIPLLLVAAIGLATGLSWYIHNLIVFGNPLGPVRVSIGGKVLWDGDVTRALIEANSLLHNFSIADRAHWSTLGFAVITQLSLPGLALIVGSASLPWTLWHQARDRPTLLAVAGLCVACLYLYVSTPWSGRFPGESGLSPFMGQAVRYGLPFLGLVAALAGASCRWASSRLLWTAVVTGCVAGMIASADPWDRIPAALKWQVALVAIAVVLGLTSQWILCADPPRGIVRFQRRHRARVRLVVAITILFGLTLVATTTALRFRRELQDRMLGGIARFVDRELPPAARLGFWGRYPAYLLYGKDLRRRLVFVDLQNARSAKDLVRVLELARVDLVAVGPRVPAWASASAPTWSLLVTYRDHFERVHGSDVRSDVLVYRLMRR